MNEARDHTKLLDELAEIATKYSVRWREMIASDLPVRGALGIDAHRAQSFMEDIRTQYAFDARDYVHGRFFNSWSVGLIMPDMTHPLRWLFPTLDRAWREAPSRPDFDLNHLARVISEKRWVDPHPLAPPRYFGGTLSIIFRLFATILQLGITGVIIAWFGELVARSFASIGHFPSTLGFAVAAILLAVILYGIYINTRRSLTERFGDWTWKALTAR